MAVTPVPLTGDEQKIWDAEWVELTSAFAKEQQGERIRAIFERNKTFIAQAAALAKGTFRGQSFGGIDAQGGFGWGLLRPEHVRRLTTDAGVTDTDWTSTPAVPGWQFYIGTAAAFNQISRRAALVIIGLVNHAPSPKTIKAQLQISGITYPPYDLYFPTKMQGGLRLFSFPSPKYLPPLENFKIQVFEQSAGADELQLLGITYAEAGYLQLQTPTLESP